MNKKLLPLTVLVLVILNAVLLFLLISPKEDKQEGPSGPKGNPIASALGFSEEQISELEPYSERHHDRMRGIDRELSQTKQLFFKELNAETKHRGDSLLQEIGRLNQDREAEVFHFMQQVQSICTPDQKRQMTRIMDRALPPGGPRGPGPKRPGPPPGKDHPRGAQGHPPPPHPEGR